LISINPIEPTRMPGSLNQRETGDASTAATNAATGSIASHPRTISIKNSGELTDLSTTEVS